MLRTLTVSASVLLASFGLAPPTLAQDHALTIEIADARSDDGALIVCVWAESGADGFPRCPSDDAVRSDTVALANGRATVVVDGLPAGRYAVSAIHDENGDGGMNRSLMRPSEGVAISGSDTISMPPPDFDDAAFALTADQSVTLKVNYW